MGAVVGIEMGYAFFASEESKGVVNSSVALPATTFSF